MNLKNPSSFPSQLDLVLIVSRSRSYFSKGSLFPRLTVLQPPSTLPAPLSLSCTLFRCLPARSLAHCCPVLLGEKNRERHACARAKQEEARATKNIQRSLYFALLHAVLSLPPRIPLALMSRRPRTAPPSPPNHARTPSDAPKETSGDLSAARPTVR